MADQKISALTAASSVDPDDLLIAVDVSDTTMNASGTNKKATREIIQTYNAGTLTSDKKLLDLSGTWNSVGTTFTGLKLNVTDTASASGSLLLDVQKGGTSQLVLDKDGLLGIGTNAPTGKITALRDYVNSSNANFVAAGSVPGFSLHAYANGRFSVFTNYTAANTTSFVVGTGTSNPSVESVVINHSTGSFTANRAGVFNESGGDYDFRIEGDTDANLFFVDASTDRVGIGTNTPAGKLHIQFANLDAAQAITLRTTNSTQGNGAIRWQGSAGTNQAFIGSYFNTADTGNLEFGTGSTTTLQLSSSGNLGLGVTPSAWATTYSQQAFQFGPVGSLSSLDAGSGNRQVSLANNAIDFSGTPKYLVSDAALAYRMFSGIHYWFTAPSGTAGNNITFTERFSASASAFVINDPGNDYDFRVEGDTDANLLFVDASTDRVGIGTNAPGYKLDLNGTLRTNNYWVLTGTPGGAGGTLRYISGAGAADSWYYNVPTGGNQYWAVNESIRMTLDYSGNLGIGTSAPDNKLTINTSSANHGVTLQQSTTTVARFAVVNPGSNNNSYIGTVSSQSFYFITNNTEQMRLDTAGNALLGGNVSPTTGTKSLCIFTGTAPTAIAADSITVYSSDVSAGNTTLSIYTEGTPVSDSTDNAVTKKIAVRINGTLYYLLADTDNS